MPIRDKFQAKTAAKWIAGYMRFVAAGISGRWIAQPLSLVIPGQVLQSIVEVAHPTSVVREPCSL